jgi:DhnA family fructose-bisphosphate aldolase class Ia
LRVDGGSGFGTPNVSVWQRYPVADATNLGVDAVGCMGLPGWPCEASNIQYMNHLASECMATGMPLMVEVMPYGEALPDAELVNALAKGVRVFAEFGADFIKTPYTGNRDSFRRVLDGTYVPVVILGGPKSSSDLDLLIMTFEALTAGAVGVAFGRNIWQHRTPGKLVQALRAVVHDGAKPEQAARLLS